MCDKNTAPSVSSISRVLRGGARLESDLNEGNIKDHSIDGILGGKYKTLDSICAHITLLAMLVSITK